MPRPSADSSVYTAIADPTRRAILALLRQREHTVNDLLARVRGSQSAVSQHLAVLRRARLVTQRRAGRHRFYRVRAEPLREVADWVAYFDAFWTGRLDALGQYLDRTHRKDQRS